MNAYKRIEQTEVYQIVEAARVHERFDPMDGTKIPFSGYDFCRLYSKRPKRIALCSARLRKGWTLPYYKSVLAFETDDIPF